MCKNYCTFARFFETVKKKYTYPTIEILPFYAVTALCTSPEGNVGGGNDPEAVGRSPQQTAPF